MSRTVYKDELIRVAVALGLPDDVDPKTIADEVDALVRRKSAEHTIRTTAEDDRNGLRAALETAARDMDQASEQLARGRQRAGSTQAYADMTAAQERLDRAFTAAVVALRG